MKKTASLISAALILLMLFSIFGVQSEETGSLTIKYMRKDNSSGISGVEMSVFKVGITAGERYALTDDFAGSGADLNSLSSAESQYKAADTLFTYAIRNGISGMTSVTDASGTAFFGGLVPGVYLAAQTKEIKGYKTISPYIVFIPESIVGGTSVYNVLSNVKTEPDSGGTQIGGGGGGSSFVYSIPVTKIWDDSEDADGIRPSSVTVMLMRGGVKYKTVSLRAENGWSHTFSNLSGSISSYTVEELPVDGYTASYSGSAKDGFTIINRHTASKPPESKDISVLVRKQWKDDNNKAGIRPNSVTVQLIKDSTVFRTAMLDASNDWSFKFEQLPEAEYTVKEISTDGYGTSYERRNGNIYTVINTAGGIDNPPPEPEKPQKPSVVDISVEKVWNDGENNHAGRPKSITVKLIKDGSVYSTLELTEQGGWKDAFKSVPADSSYTVIEDAPENYSAAYVKNEGNGFTVINSFTPGITDSGTPPPPFIPVTDEVLKEPSDDPSPAESTSAAIPQTGTLNWPVPVLAIIGIIFIIIGIIRIFGKRSEEK